MGITVARRSRRRGWTSNEPCQWLGRDSVVNSSLRGWYEANPVREASIVQLGGSGIRPCCWRAGKPCIGSGMWAGVLTRAAPTSSVVPTGRCAGHEYAAATWPALPDPIEDSQLRAPQRVVAIKQGQDVRVWSPDGAPHATCRVKMAADCPNCPTTDLNPVCGRIVLACKRWFVRIVRLRQSADFRLKRKDGPGLSWSLFILAECGCAGWVGDCPPRSTRW